MRRREFITLLGGAAAAWPLAARAQQPAQMRRIGVLMGRAAGDAEGQKQAAVLRRGLEELHWLSPRNLEIEYRWTAGDPVRAQAQAKEIVELGVDIIVANGTPALVAARRASETIPIVFVAVADPVAQGFVRSLAQPGGMITGFGAEEPSMGAKWVEVLKEIAPRVASITVMFNPDSAPFARMFFPSMQALRSAASFELMEAPVTSESDLERAISVAAAQPAAGLIVLPDSFLVSRREPIVTARGTVCQRSIRSRSSPAAADWLPMGSSGPTYSDARRPMWIASSRAPSPPTCRSSSRLSLSWPSISKPQRRLASRCPRSCK
jgi:putative ABC transport system substrate-binding protein